MAWEWVPPVATFATGLTGMYFTYRTAKSQQGAQLATLTKQLQGQREAEFVKEKRQVYSDFVGTVEAAVMVGHIVKSVRRKTEAAVLGVYQSQNSVRTVESFEELPFEVKTRHNATLRESVEGIFGLQKYSNFSPTSLDDLLSRATKVQMIGDKEVSILTGALMAKVINYLKLDKFSESDFASIRGDLRALVDSMRKDLGIGDGLSYHAMLTLDSDTEKTVQDIADASLGVDSSAGKE
ncbi:hypothetical protein ACFV4N_08345 [Actinosynnema sp. NPDC059797]